MGVPKFFRFINERYPCLSDVIKEYEVIMGYFIVFFLNLKKTKHFIIALLIIV